GSFTIKRFDRQAFSEPAAVLTVKQRQIFMTGRSVFNRQWAAVTSLNGDWGPGAYFHCRPLQRLPHRVRSRRATARIERTIAFHARAPEHPWYGCARRP
ncbi:MAG TPA: hypothetical protein VN496_02365, partial [Burkholderiales bacterium]|nr:hypothetical protein [Burkholderiales bacterium]